MNLDVPDIVEFGRQMNMCLCIFADNTTAVGLDGAKYGPRCLQ